MTTAEVLLGALALILWMLGAALMWSLMQHLGTTAKYQRSIVVAMALAWPLVVLLAMSPLDLDEWAP